MELGIIALAAALAVSLPAIATAWSQSKIGAAMAGALAEKPELAGNAIIMIAIPETMVVLGFVIAFLITGMGE
ncbi:MAG: ATPase [Actinomycetota bacterium]|nr:ATPase [Actinomycetota bacterium]